METPTFMIDDAAAPGLGLDTKHTPIPGKLSARRNVGFVGDEARYLIKGVTRPKSWLIQGPLLADDFAALYAHIATYEQMLEDIAPHKLTIHGVNFEDADLKSFDLRGAPHAYSEEGLLVPGARVMVRMVWELLA